MLGLVRAPGTKLDVLETILKEILADYGFKYAPVRVFDSANAARSEYATIDDDWSAWTSDPDFREDFLKFSTWDKRCREIQRGNQARELTFLDDIVLRDALVKVQEMRRAEYSSKHVAWGFRAIRHPDEVNLLRDIYGGRYFTIGVYESRGAREANRVDDLRGEFPTADDTLLLDAARFLIAREDRVGTTLKTVRIQSTFEKSDIFVDISRLDLMRRAVRRFIAYVLGYPFGTPTVDEFGMAVAFAGRKSSSALARAVGAAALSPETGAILATGHNDVPRTPLAGPWPDDDLSHLPDAEEQEPDGDYREHRYGYDVSDTRRFAAFKDLIERLSAAGVLDLKKFADKPRGRQFDEAHRRKAVENIFARPGVRGAIQFDAIEYSRTIHAEASLVAAAAAAGVSLTGSTLFVTTFPCHECSRLIIRAGIKRVVFVEPYPKSLAAELHRPQIHYQDADTHLPEPHPLQVQYEPFVGIAPGRFNEIFSFEARKKSDTVEADHSLDGKTAHYPPDGGYRPRASILSLFLSQPEAILAMRLLERLAIRQATEAWSRQGGRPTRSKRRRDKS